LTEKFKLSRKDFIVLAAATILALLIRPVVELISRSKKPVQPATATDSETPTELPSETQVPTEPIQPTEIPTDTPTTQVRQLLTPEKIDFLVKHPINHGNTGKKIVIMTYDEGTVPANIEHLLDVYKTFNGKCTFFMTGDGLEQSKNILGRIRDEGHFIGCHSYDHINLAELTNDKITDQFNRWQDKFHSILPDYQTAYFRAPYGSYNSRVLEIAASFGMQHVFWNVESGGITSDTIKYIFDQFQQYENYYQAIGGAIVLSHTMRYYDISQAEDILKKWTELGYTLVTIDQGKKDSDTWKS